MKEPNLPAARAIFEDTGIQFTTQGRRYLGAAIGSTDFVQMIKRRSGLMNYLDCQRLPLLSHMLHILPSLMGFKGDGLFCQELCLE